MDMSLQTGLLDPVASTDEWHDPAEPTARHDESKLHKGTRGWYLPRRHVFTLCGFLAVCLSMVIDMALY